MHLFRSQPALGGVTPKRRKWHVSAALTLIVAFIATTNLINSSSVPPAAAASGAGVYVFGAANGIALTSPYSAGTNPHFSWASLEPSEGVYNWSALDKALSDAQKAGRKVVPRIFTNKSGFSQASPDWFFKTRGAQFYYPSTTYKAPVGWDPVYQAKFGNFLKALGERYNGNTAIEFFEITGVGVYGEMYLEHNPSGYTIQKHKDSIRFWTDAWLSAFPSTHLSLIINALGADIAESNSSYAVSRGVYLQMNTPVGNGPTRAILDAHDSKTKIVIEAENGGCRDATGSAFQGMMTKVFSYDYAVHYLFICGQSLSGNTDATLQSVVSNLETGESATPLAAPTKTPMPTATSFAAAPPAPATATPTKIAPAATATKASATATKASATATKTPFPSPTATKAAPTPTSTPTATPTSTRRWWSWWW